MPQLSSEPHPESSPHEEPLTGGNMDPVVRVGDTVRRVSGDWTPAVHELLGALEAAGIDETPRAFGVDDRGREVLSHLPGSVLADAPADVLWAESTLQATAALLRRMHDASVPLARADTEEPRAWRSPVREPNEVVCHNDFAPYNLIARNGELSGVIDFDFASPGPRIWDLAYLAYRLVPWADDADAPADLDRDARLTSLVSAYGIDVSPESVRRVAAARLDDLAAFTDARFAETGDAALLDHAAIYRADAAALRKEDR